MRLTLRYGLWTDEKGLLVLALFWPENRYEIWCRAFISRFWKRILGLDVRCKIRRASIALSNRGGSTDCAGMECLSICRYFPALFQVALTIRLSVDILQGLGGDTHWERRIHHNDPGQHWTGSIDLGSNVHSNHRLKIASKETTSKE